MVRNKDRWSSLSMKERMFLMQEYVKNGITDLTSMRKHYNGIPYKDLNTSDYDYFNASPDMEPKKEGQHWYSRNPETGRILKREDHPTFDLAVKGENEAGYVIRRGIDGNLYSLPKNINYVEKPNILDGTETEQTLSGKKPTLEEFIQSKVDSTRNAAFENSKNRKIGIKIPYKASKEYLEGSLRTIIDKREIADTNFIGPSIKRKEYVKNRSGNINDYRKIYYNALQEYNDKCDYGYNCIGTATDNYPEDSRTVTNEDFYKNFNKYGFVRIPFSEVKQGDIVQSYNHALIYSGQDEHGYPLFNYSKGGVTEFDYVKDGHYPSDNYIVSRYVGTPELIQQWTTEYENTYNKKYGGKINKFVTGGPTESLYYDDTYIEPAVVKAFDSSEDYNRYYGERFGKQIARKRDKVANSIMRALEYTPFVGDGIDAANTIASIHEGDYSQAAVLAGLTLLPNAIESIGKVVTRPFKNARRLKRMKETYTGVRHIPDRNNPHITMDDNFPTYNGTIWSSETPEYARQWVYDTEGKVYKVLTDPSELKMVETPVPNSGEYYPWNSLPYELKDGKVSSRPSMLVDSHILPDLETAVKYKRGVEYGELSEKEIRELENNFLKGRANSGTDVTTDNIVEQSYIQGFDGVNFKRVYDGPSVKDGIIVDVPINETVLNPHVPHIVLPENKSKWSLLFKDLDDLTIKKFGGKL